jgi:hypothetical protein
MHPPPALRFASASVSRRASRPLPHIASCQSSTLCFVSAPDSPPRFVSIFDFALRVSPRLPASNRVSPRLASRQPPTPASLRVNLRLCASCQPPTLVGGRTAFRPSQISARPRRTFRAASPARPPPSSSRFVPASDSRIASSQPPTRAPYPSPSCATHHPSALRFVSAPDFSRGKDVLQAVPNLRASTPHLSRSLTRATASVLASLRRPPSPTSLRLSLRLVRRIRLRVARRIRLRLRASCQPPTRATPPPRASCFVPASTFPPRFVSVFDFALRVSPRL